MDRRTVLDDFDEASEDLRSAQTAAEAIDASRRRQDAVKRLVYLHPGLIKPLRP